MKKAFAHMLVFTLLLILLGVQSVYADQPEPPQPLVIPAEINVDPYSQTVFSPNYQAVWEVGVEGEGSNYCIKACWGDPCGCAQSCGYTTGTYYYYHQFRCGGSSPYSQTWTLSNGPGTPVQDFSVVYK
jgi:hypothetical protein